MLSNYIQQIIVAGIMLPLQCLCAVDLLLSTSNNSTTTTADLSTLVITVVHAGDITLSVHVLDVCTNRAEGVL